MSNLNEETTEKLIKIVTLVHEKLTGDSLKIDANFEAITLRIENIEKALEKLTKDSSDGFTNVGDQITGLKEEVIKIQKISGYSEQFENLMKIVR